MVHVKFHENGAGDLVDIDQYCSATCFTDGTGEPAFGHAWPGGMETDYDSYCNGCGTLIAEGVEHNHETTMEGDPEWLIQAETLPELI